MLLMLSETVSQDQLIETLRAILPLLLLIESAHFIAELIQTAV
jgi:hypothetical protein